MKAARLRFIKFTGQQFKQEEKKRDRERERARERKLGSFVRGLAAESSQTTGTKFDIYSDYDSSYTNSLV